MFDCLPNGWMDKDRRDWSLLGFRPRCQTLAVVMDKAEAFIQWLRDNGAMISPKIGIKDYSHEGAGLGVAALSDIKVNESGCEPQMVD